MGRIMNKNLFVQTMLDKSNKIKQKWKGLQKSDIWICLHFHYNCQSFITGNETMKYDLCLHPNLRSF